MRIYGLLVAAAFSTSACVFGPYDGSEVASTGSSIRVSGYSPSASQTLIVEAGPSASGPWTSVGSMTTASTKFITYDGYDLFTFGRNVVIPQSIWQTSGCDSVAYLRVRDTGNFTYFSFQAVAPDGSAPVSCIVNEVNGGQSLPNATANCKSPNSPSIEVRVPSGAGFTHNGNVTISSPAQATQWQCLKQLNGNLTVSDMPLMGYVPSLAAIELPTLERVNGDVNLAFQLPTVAWGPNARQVELPNLTQVTGDLNLRSDRHSGGSSNAIVRAGMPNLTTVGGDVDIFCDATGSTWFGLDSVAELPGSLSVSLNADWGLPIFPALTRVRQNVTLELGYNGVGGLDELREVDGSFTQEGGRHFSALAVAKLRRVGGDFTLRDVPVYTGQRLYPELYAVGGTLRLDNAVQSGSGLIVGDPWLLTVNTVDIRNNDQPTFVDLHNVEPTPYVPLTFVNNANMCSSSIQAWANSRPGWAGTAALVQSGNDDGC